jgi:uncharacterized membrane protein
MRSRTHEDRFGCSRLVLGVLVGLALLVGLIASRGGFEGGWRALTSSFGGGEQDTEPRQDAFAEQLQALQEQAQLLEGEILRLHQERMALRKERIQGLATQYTKGDARQYDRILLHNRCSFPLDVALYYRDLDDAWIARGWWRVEPDATVTTDAMSRTSPVYFYAENLTESRVLDGTSDEGAQTLEVSNSRFDSVQEDAFRYPGLRSVSFYPRQTGEIWTDFVEELRCPVEAPPEG